MKHKWRNPRTELPEDNEVVVCLLAPHKWRGDLRSSLASMEIVCGAAHRVRENHFEVDNGDELGDGSICYYTWRTDYKDHIFAWMPVDEFPLPDWDSETINLLRTAESPPWEEEE